MRYNTVLDVAIKRSKDLFTLPSLRTALLLNILAVLLPSGELHALGYLLEASRYLLSTALFSLASFITLWRSAPYFDVRRSLWASFFSIVPLALGAVLEIVNLPFYSMLYTSILLTALASWSLGEDIRSRILPFLLIVIALAVNGFLFKIAISSLVALLSAYLVGKIIGKITEPVLGLKDFEGVKALAEVVLGNLGKRLERSLEERGVHGFVTFDVIRFKDSVIVTADLHPGPYKMGSFDAPSRIMEAFESKGLNPIFLRRACSHERNLSSRRYLQELIRGISDSIKSLSPCCVGEPVFDSTEHFELSAQRFGDIVLFTISGHPMESFEDIPHEIEEIASRELGFSISVVDRHDSLRQEWHEMAFPDSELGKELVQALVSLGKRAIEARTYQEVEFGFAMDHPGWPSLGRGGVRVLSLRTPEWAIAYLCIDGNNMVPELRRKLDELSPKDMKVVVATTDTHEVLSTKATYNPVGVECKSEECLENEARYLLDLVQRSIESMKLTKVECYRGRGKVVFIGRDLMAMLSSLIESISMAKHLIALALLPQIPILLLSVP